MSTVIVGIDTLNISSKSNSCTFSQSTRKDRIRRILPCDPRKPLSVPRGGTQSQRRRESAAWTAGVVVSHVRVFDYSSIDRNHVSFEHHVPQQQQWEYVATSRGMVILISTNRNEAHSTSRKQVTDEAADLPVKGTYNLHSNLESVFWSCIRGVYTNGECLWASVPKLKVRAQKDPSTVGALRN